MQVLIKTPTASTFAIVIHHNETVKDLKRVIQDIDKTYINPFSLKFGTKYLEDHHPLTTYNLKEGSVIQLLPFQHEDSMRSPKHYGKTGKVNPLAYKSMVTRSVLKESIESLQSGFTQAITNSFPKAEDSEISIGQPINSIQCNDEHHLAFLGTDTGNILHYNYTKKETVETFSRTKDHGLSRMAVAGITDIFVVGAPKGIFLYRGPERAQIVHTLSPATIFEVTKGGEYVFYKKGERMIEKYSIVDMKRESVFDFPGPIRAMALSDKEDKLFIGGFETEIRIFSTIDSSLLKVLPNSKQGSATLLKVTSDEKSLISVSSKRYIKIYNLETSECHMFRHTHSSDITSIALSPDNKILFSGSEDGSLTIYDLEKLVIIHSINNYQTGGIRALQMTKNGKRLLSGGDAGNIKIYDIESTDQIVTVPTEYDSINWLTSYWKRRQIVAACKDGSIRMFNNVTGELEGSIENIGAGQAYIVACRPNDQCLIAAAFGDKSIRVFNYNTGEEFTRMPEAHTEQITGLVFSRDSKVLISSSTDKSLKVWDAFSSVEGPMYVDVNSHTDAISFIRLSSNGKYLVTATWGRTISVFEFSQIHSKDRKDVELRRVHMFKDAHDGHITSLAISSDNKYIVSGGSDLAIKLFDFERRNFICAFYNCHKSLPNSVNLMQDNQYIVSIDEGGQVNYFNVATRKLVYSETIPNAGKINTTVITKASTQIMTGSANGKLHIINNVLIPHAVKITCGSITVNSNLGFCLLEHFIYHAVSSRKRIDLISKYSNLYIHPHEWNFLHIVAIYAPRVELIDACIKEKIPFTKDSHGYTPLHYLLHANSNDVTAVNHLLAKFGELIQDERDLYSVVGALSNQIQDIIKFGSFQAANFLEYGTMIPQQFAKNSITCFGHLKKGKSRYVVGDSTVFTPEIKEDLVGPEGEQMLAVKVIGFKFDYGPSSRDMLRLMLFLNDVDNEQIYKSFTIHKIIDYLWSKNRRFFYLPSVIYSCAMIVLSSYCGQDIDKRSFGHEVALITIGSLSFVYELWLLIVESSLYLTDLWNLVDIVVNSLLIASSITIWTTGKNSPSSSKLLTATLFFGYLRWFSYFRLIDQTRKLSKMISEILKDMTSFLVVLAFVTVGFGFIFLQLRPQSTLTDQMLYTYNLIYTNYEELPVGPEIPYFVVFTVFMSVTLLNLLIAIMNETYGRVQGSRHYYENKTRVNLIIEAITAKRFLLKVTSGIRQTRIWRTIKSCCFVPKLGSLPDLAFEKDFASQQGFLYFVEEVKKQEYEQRLTNNTNSEGKTTDDDTTTEAFQNVLREELKVLKKEFEGAEEERSNNIEAERRGKEALNQRMGRLEDKMELILKLLGNQPARSGQPSYKEIDHGPTVTHALTGRESTFARSPGKQSGPQFNNFTG